MLETSLETQETLDARENTLDAETETLDAEQIEQIEQIETVDDGPDVPKKKGRPTGARSKVQGKPRPKRVEANRIKKENLPSPELPPPLAGSRPIPQSTNDRTSALMLTLLRQQAADRRQRKVDVWKSWFTK